MKLLSKKNRYFAGFGAGGGLLSALLWAFVGSQNPMASWVVTGALDSALIGVLLIIAQDRYLARGLSYRALAKATVLGLPLGALGGFLAITAGFGIAGALGMSSETGRLIGWAISGGVAGFVASLGVPNLKRKVAIIAGGVGGALGCQLMYLIGSYEIGVAVTGAAIGVMVAVAEAAFRKAWIEVDIRPVATGGIALAKSRHVTLTLGDRPIVFGAAAGADVLLDKASGVPAEAAVLTLDGGHVVFKDLTKGTRETYRDGARFDFFNASVAVALKAA